MTKLNKEKAETKERIAKLKEQTKLERLRKEVTNHERELIAIKRPSIFDWLKRIFKKGGKNQWTKQNSKER